MNSQEFDALVSTLPELNARMIAKMAGHHQVHGSWTEVSLDRAMEHLHDEIEELALEIAALKSSRGSYTDAANECADIAAMTLIIMYRVRELCDV